MKANNRRAERARLALRARLRREIQQAWAGLTLAEKAALALERVSPFGLAAWRKAEAAGLPALYQRLEKVETAEEQRAALAEIGPDREGEAAELARIVEQAEAEACGVNSGGQNEHDYGGYEVEGGE